jgi:hypothetical protein
MPEPPLDAARINREIAEKCLGWKRQLSVYWLKESFHGCAESDDPEYPWYISVVAFSPWTDPGQAFELIKVLVSKGFWVTFEHWCDRDQIVLNRMNWGDDDLKNFPGGTFEQCVCLATLHAFNITQQEG